ncbi:MAG: hypothetical protein LAQ69_45330 [Acidobacteriia bacterium]|nr:hypothetical protein [Terriglobia bacterium]
MPISRWRERREVYLRGSARTADLVREGFINSGIEVVKGRGLRVCGAQAASRLVLVARAGATIPSGERVFHDAKEVD